MKLILDFLPIVIFFGVYKYTDDIIIATAVLIPATIIQVLYTRWKTGKVEKMQIATLVLVIFFGGLTVLFKDAAFIQWKPTIVNWLFALVFVGSHFIGNKTVVQRLMESGVQLPQTAWQKLNISWVAFFTLLGILNLYVAFNFSEATWVNFKLFGMLGITLVFIVLQGIYIARYAKLVGEETDQKNKNNPSQNQQEQD